MVCRSMMSRLVMGLSALVVAALPAAAQTHLVIISGLGGDRKYVESFAKISSTLADAATKRFAVPEAEVVWLGEDSTSKRPFFRGQSTKANIERTFSQLAARVGAGDQIVVVLVGHGSGDGADTKI